MHSIRSVLCLGVLALCGLAQAQTQVQRFDAPQHENYGVSYCNAGGTLCGESVAHDWCRTQGFDRAVEWSAQAGSDFSTATVSLNEGRICRGAQCESFAAISCETARRSFRMPTLAGLTRSTVISPDRRNVEMAVAPVEYEVLIPGCQQREPGVFLCQSVYEYQHCRTLLKSGKVFGCRAGLAFEGRFAEPMAVVEGEYELDLKSNAQATVYRGRRGDGKLRGEARFEIRFVAPVLDPRDWCLQRDRYIYYPSGPKGGLAEIDATADCEDAIQGSFKPHEDDLIEAYDICEGMVSWGGKVQHDLHLLVGALFHVGSARPGAKASAGGSHIVAPYLTIKAPLTVNCKD